MHRIFMNFALALVIFCIPQIALTDTIVKSGDAEIDAGMKGINAFAKENLKEFTRRTGEKFGVSVAVVDALLRDRKMSPADAHMTLNVATIAHRSVDEVADAYERDRDKGWGVIAKEMGIKPGSAEFHALKANSRGDVSKGKKSKKGKTRKKGKDKGKKKNQY